ATSPRIRYPTGKMWGVAMSRKLSNRQIGLALAGSVLLALGIGSGIRLITASNTESSSEATPLAASSNPDASSPVFQSGPFVPSSQALRLADPGLLRSTSQEARLQTVATGRPDPFAPIVQPSLTPKKPQPAAASTNVAPPPSAPAQVQPQTLPVIPVAATQALPPLPSIVPPPLPSLGPIAATQPIELGAGSLPSPTLSLVDRIEISGVAQIGSQINVIVKEPGTSISRYVRAGDAIAGGQVRVKRIELSSAEPQVVLEYNGKEFYRSVGSATLAGLM
ncbi:MAG TPA: hypothetical protein V6D29_14855, partial [Leptolyngbyaceae cyanobacterium]